MHPDSMVEVDILPQLSGESLTHPILILGCLPTMCEDTKELQYYFVVGPCCWRTSLVHETKSRLGLFRRTH